jgi:hypothetical protein
MATPAAAAAPAAPAQQKKKTPLVISQHFHPILASSRKVGETMVISEVVCIAKGNSPQPDDRARPNDPGVIYIDVGSGSGGISRFSRSLQEVAPKTYATAKHPTAPVPFKIKAVFISPIMDGEDAVRMSRLPADHRLGLGVIEDYRITRRTLDEMAGDIAELRAQNPGYKVVYNFTHSFYYMDQTQYHHLIPGDIVFITAHHFRGQSGEFPAKSPEYAWYRSRVGGIDEIKRDTITMHALHPGGTTYRHRDVTHALDRRYLPYRRSRVILGPTVGTTQALNAGVVRTTGGGSPYTLVSGVGDAGIYLTEWRPLVTAAGHEHVASVYRGVVVDHEAKYTQQAEVNMNHSYCTEESVRTKTRTLVSRISVDGSLTTLAADLHSVVSVVQNASQALNLQIDELRNLVMSEFEHHVSSEQQLREKLGGMVVDIRKARAELKVHSPEGFLTRHAAKAQSEGTSGAVSDAFLYLRRKLADGSAS